MKPKILEKVVFLDHLMGYFGSEGIYDSNLSFWKQNKIGPNATSGDCTYYEFLSSNTSLKFTL